MHFLRRSTKQVNIDREIVTALLAGQNPADLARRRSADDHTARLLLESIGALQESTLWELASGLSARLRSAHWLLGALATLEHGRGVTVDRRVDLGRDEFLREYYYRNRAVVLSGCAADWPAVKTWNRQSLREKCAEATVEVMGSRSSAARQRQNTSASLKRTMRWPEFVDKVFESSGNDLYLVSRNYAFENPQLAPLRDDLGSSPLVETAVAGKAVRLWFGPAGTTTPWHHDDRNNVIIELLGRKTVSLLPLPFAELACQRQLWYAGGDTATGYAATKELMDKFAVTVDLGPGDGLFIPVGWWHAVVAEKPSMTIACVDFKVDNQYDRPEWLGLYGL